MIFQNLQLLTSAPVEFIRLLLVIFFGLIIGITVHEFSHAFIAYRLGDDTAQRLGRTSFNPLVHLDLLGTLMLFLVGFGWGKPVPVNASNLRAPVRLSMAAVSVSGILANMLTAAVIALLVRFGPVGYPKVILVLLMFTVQINVLLAFFNLIPFPPLDGFNIMASLLPDSVMRSVAPAVKWGPFIFLTVLIMDNLFPINILGTVIGWPVSLVTRALLG